MLRNLGLMWDKQNQKDKPSLESIEKFEHVHDQKEPSLGAKANIFPLDEAGDVQQLLITEKLFARALIKSFTHTECTETIKVISPKRESDGLQTVVGALTGNVKDRVLLMNKEGNLIAVFIQNIHVRNQIYHIYGTEPIVKRQKPAKNVNHEGQPLYDWARAKIPKRDLDLTMDMVDEETGEYEPTYTIERMREKNKGFFAPKPFLVKKLGTPAATLRRGEFPSGMSGPVWKVKLCPGIDPILIVGFVAIFDTQNI